MIKTFITGVVLGIVSFGAALYLVPVVEQYREVSMITVKPNGGNAESFHVNIPMDRIMSGAPEQKAPVPVGMEWPSDDKFSGVRAELFKVRNSKDAVVGVASRIAAERDADGSIIPAIMTDHMLNISTTSPAVHADVIGIANGDPIWPIRIVSNPR